MAAEDANIKNLEDVKDKIIKPDDPGSENCLNALQFFRTTGLDPEKDFKGKD